MKGWVKAVPVREDCVLLSDPSCVIVVAWRPTGKLKSHWRKLGCGGGVKGGDGGCSEGRMLLNLNGGSFNHSESAVLKAKYSP